MRNYIKPTILEQHFPAEQGFAVSNESYSKDGDGEVNAGWK